MLEQDWRTGIFRDQLDQMPLSAVASEFYHDRPKAAMGRVYFYTQRTRHCRRHAARASLHP